MNTSNSSSVLANYVSEAQLAEQLGVSVRTLARWRSLRQAPRVTRVGRRLLFNRTDIDHWLATQSDPSKRHAG